MATEPNQGWDAIGTDDLKQNWGWFLGVGVVLVILGLLALLSAVTATMLSVELLGWLLLIGGILALVHAVLRRRWGGFFLELFTGILNIVVGLMLLDNPLAGAAILTLLIAMFLLIGGIFRIVASVAVRFHHWPWMLLNGVVSLLLGIMIWRQWPESSLWVIGLFIGIDMIFYGWSLVMLGVTAKSLAA
jgi:uncharacterized membrane protein HdeD (DUF308 family)